MNSKKNDHLMTAIGIIKKMKIGQFQLRLFNVISASDNYFFLFTYFYISAKLLE